MFMLLDEKPTIRRIIWQTDLEGTGARKEKKERKGDEIKLILLYIQFH